MPKRSDLTPRELSLLRTLANRPRRTGSAYKPSLALIKLGLAEDIYDPDALFTRRLKITDVGRIYLIEYEDSE